MPWPNGENVGHVSNFFKGGFLVRRTGKKGVGYNTIVDDDDEVAAYASPDYSDSSWENISVPGQWHILGISNVETVWYRRNVFIKNVFFDKPISIRVPNIADAHELFFNGVKIGGAGIISSSGRIIKKSCVSGIYQIPADIIKYDSDNLIAIRVCDDVGWGGFITTNFFAGSSKLLRINFQ